MRSVAEWQSILVQLGVQMAVAQAWAPYFAEVVIPENFSLGDEEIDDFLSQVLHESGRLETMEENLSYSVDGLLKTFSRSRISEVDAKRYGRIPGVQKADKVMIANTLYGGDWGARNLGNTQPNDGWDFRGSGPIQVTGRGNFAALEKATGIPFTKYPDLLRKAGVEALRACIAWWEGHVPDSVMGNATKVRKSVNGGTLGLDDTTALAGKADKLV